MRLAAAAYARSLSLDESRGFDESKARRRARYASRRAEHEQRRGAYLAKHPEGDVRDLRAWAWRTVHGWHAEAVKRTAPPYSFAAGLEAIEKRRLAGRKVAQ